MENRGIEKIERRYINIIERNFGGGKVGIEKIEEGL